MCGIAGVFGAARPDVVERMLATIVHRGPDDGYQVSRPGFTLGARRLSIIDLDGGRQPIANERGDVWAAQNGEIYNFPQLAERLVARGHTLATRCDTEVIAHQYEESGVDLPRALDGMFALAAFDARDGRGLLARDRMGKKPLYYYEDPNGGDNGGGALWFASEIKALLVVPGFERAIDWEAIHHFLGFKHVPAPLTAFKGIRMLAPAHRLEWADGRIVSVERYWRPDYTPFEEPLDEGEMVDRFLQKLRDGVKRRLISDVPIGFFLSGGLDSSLSTCIAAELNDQPIRTFTLTYSEESTTPGKQLDLACARRVAQQYGTRHHEEQLDYARFPDEFGQIIRHFDEPFGGVVSTWFLSRLISRHVKVTLSGDGADELFGSYLSHRLAQPLDAYTRGERTSADFEGRIGFLERLRSEHDWEWRDRLLVFSDDEKRSLYSPALREVLAPHPTRALMREMFTGLTARDPLNRVLEAEFLTFFPDQVLTFVDRLSMAHSLEVRTAFLDTALVEFVARLPARFKIRDGVTKYLLKQAALRYLPDDIVNRPKEGFVMPINQWLMTHLRDYVLDLLSPARLRAQGYFDAAAVATITDAFYAGDTTLANKILSLLAFQVWHDVCFSAPAEAAISTPC